MLKRGHGTIIYTSATAAYRGNSGQHAHTMAMGGRMRLTQSLNAELGPQGIHICHVNMDVRIPPPSPAMTSLSPRPHPLTCLFRPLICWICRVRVSALPSLVPLQL